MRLFGTEKIISQIVRIGECCNQSDDCVSKYDKSFCICSMRLQGVCVLYTNYETLSFCKLFHTDSDDTAVKQYFVFNYTIDLLNLLKNQEEQILQKLFASLLTVVSIGNFSLCSFY